MTVTCQDSLMDTYKRWPVNIVSGSGATVVSDDGRSYVDMVAGIAVASLGHSHPRLVEAVTEQAQAIMHISNLFGNPISSQLATRLERLTGMQAFFCNSGTEAVEAAIKLVRAWARREGRGSKILAAAGGFHGRTLGALAATGQPDKRDPFAPLPDGFEHVAYGDIDALRHAIDGEVAAVLLEPIQGEGGVVVPPAGYLAHVSSLCEAAGALLVVDEVQTGVGRTGRWFAHEWDGILPDVMCLAKGLGGGLPIGACLARPEIGAAFSPGDHGCTFGGGPVQSAAALAVLDVIEDEGLLDRVDRSGRELIRRLGQIFGSGVEVRGRGFMLGVDLNRPVAREVVGRCLKKGVLVNNPTPSVLRLTPPLIIGGTEIDTAMAVLEEVWHDVRQAP